MTDSTLKANGSIWVPARQALQNSSASYTKILEGLLQGQEQHEAAKVQAVLALLIRESSVSTQENVCSQGSWLSA